MAIFDITLEDGNTVTLESDQEPTEEDVYRFLQTNYGPPSPPRELPIPSDIAAGLGAVNQAIGLADLTTRITPQAWEAGRMPTPQPDITPSLQLDFVGGDPSFMSAPAPAIDPRDIAMESRARRGPEIRGIPAEAVAEEIPDPERQQAPGGISRFLSEFGTAPVGLGQFGKLEGQTISPGSEAARAQALAAGGGRAPIGLATPTSEFLQLLPEGKVKDISTGAYNAATSLFNFFLSPLGASTFGVGNLPQLAQRGVAAKFAYDMAIAAPEELAAGDEAIRRGDMQGAVQHWLSGASSLGLAGLTGTHAVRPIPIPSLKPKPPVIEGAPNALQQTPETVLRDVREPQVAQEGAQPLPATEVGAKATEALKENVVPEITQFRSDFEASKPIPTEAAVRAGMQAKSIADLEFLAETQRRRKAEVDEARKKWNENPDNTELQQDVVTKALTIQLPREAIEGATNVGSNAEGNMGLFFGERPLDWKKNPEVADWLRKNGEALNIVLPDEIKSGAGPVSEALRTPTSTSAVPPSPPAPAATGGAPPGAPPPTPPGAPPAPSPTPAPRGVTLDDVYSIFEPSKKTRPSLKQRAVNLVEALRTGVSSKFRPVNKLAEDIGKAYGKTTAKNIAGIMEQLKGSQGKGEAQIYRFDRDVSSKVKGNEKDFNAYLFLKRSIDRLEADARDIAAAQAGAKVPTLNRRAVAGYTLNQLQPKLAALEAKLGPERLRQFQQASDGYQRYMDEALKLQVESGRMSQEVYDAIKDGNQFYAPFKVMKWIEETSQPSGTGRRIDTMAEFTKAMTGIEDPNFKLGDMLGAARQNILLSRILADKNMAMRHVAELAAFDTQGQFIKKLGASEDVPKGFEAVNVLEQGKQNRYAVRPDVAEAIQLYGPEGGGLIVRALSTASVPFRVGATTFNLPFQISNLMADVPRQALVSKYGIRGVGDMVRYPLDFIQSLYSSIAGDVFGRDNKLFLDFLDSGAAGTTVQEFLTPEALRFKEPTSVSKSRTLASTVLNVIPDFAKAIEQTSKIVGVKRAMRFEGVQSGAELAKQIPEAITEIRRFSGSPDFGRQGKAVEQARLNLLYMFLNARIQGAVADIGRLSGRDSAKTAGATWLKVGSAVAIPTAYLYSLNNSPEYKNDYAKRPEQEKQNYWLIPKDTFITTEDGEVIRDYWRIPKREISKWFANATESALNFASNRDPQAAADFGVRMLEEISPVNIQGDTLQERMESTASSLNPILKAPLELATGRDLYRHRDLMTDQLRKASPENQFTDRTASAFKSLAEVMPDVAPEFMRSPIILENLTRNLTAGLVTQFMPRKPVEGRSGFEQNPLFQRFQALPLVDQEAFKLELQKLERDAADEQLARHRKATKLIEDNKGATLDQIVPKAGDDPRLIKHLVDLWVSKANGATFQDRQLLALPARQRADYVAGKLKGVNAVERQKLILEFARKRILTEAVVQELPEAFGAAPPPAPSSPGLSR